LYAAVSEEALGGALYEPEDAGLRGYPCRATIRENALDEAGANKLWRTAEEITGIVFPS
jgi:hypothetical protein